MTVDAPATLQQASDQYLASLPAADAAAKTIALRKFVEFVGPAANLPLLVPHQVAAYGESLHTTMTNPGARVEPVKDFLKYAFKKQWTSVNLASHIKVRAARRAPGSARREPTRIKLTAEGAVRLQEELDELKARIPELAQAITIAAADKDFKENQPFHAAREEKAKVDSRIRDLEAQLGLADIIDNKAGSQDRRVRLGRSVRVLDLTYEETFTWTIVSPSEVDTRAGRISAESPAGKALLDKSEGDHVDVQAPAGILRYRIVEIIVEF